MDAVGLEILLREIVADQRVMQDAVRKAKSRLEARGAGFLEAAAFELSRHYNVLEKIFERVCDGFENHFERRGDYHERLLQRMVLDLPSLRPAFAPASTLADLRELKGFRHVVRHAYDLTLREDRVRELAQIAERVTRDLPEWVETFARKVRHDQGWE